MPYEWLINRNGIMDMFIDGWVEEEKLRRELAKQNYLNIHQKRKKKR